MENFEIISGEKFLCIKTVLSSRNKTYYKQGKVYFSELNGCITDELNEKEHEWTKIPFQSHFINLKETRNKVIEKVLT